MFEANGFLQNMVRNIVGVLTAIGSQEEPVIWARQVLESKDPNEGWSDFATARIVFLGPTYDDDFGLSKTVRIPQIAKDILFRSVTVGAMTRVKFCGLTHEEILLEP